MREIEAKYRARAKDLLRGATTTIEIYSNAPVSVDDEGAYVQAWVWVPLENEEDKDAASRQKRRARKTSR